ncbi:MAG: hypothetical protein U1E29_04960 [Coriobacteriia bacterium]|nr:hypothetical protein [Coriobacteriia bacterium]
MTTYCKPTRTATPACPRCGVTLEAIYPRYSRDREPTFWGCYECNVAWRRDDLPAPDAVSEATARDD